MTALAQCDDEAALLDARSELEHRNQELERSNEELERFAYCSRARPEGPAVARRDGPGGGRAGGWAGARAARHRPAGRRRGCASSSRTCSPSPPSGRRPATIVRVDLDDLLDQVLTDLERTIEEAGATIERTPLPEVLGHPALLGQLLQNLISQRGEVRRPDVGPVVRVSGSRQDGGVTILVADNGIGIAPEHRSEVFGVFTRLNHEDASPGSGIGLATCAKVVHHHGGRIWVEDGHRRRGCRASLAPRRPRLRLAPPPLEPGCEVVGSWPSSHPGRSAGAPLGGGARARPRRG